VQRPKPIYFRPLLGQPHHAGFARSQVVITRIPLGVDLRSEGAGGVVPARRSGWRHLMPWRRARSR